MQREAPEALGLRAEKMLRSFRQAFGASQIAPGNLEAAYWNLTEVVADPDLLVRLVSRPESQVLYQFSVEPFTTNVYSKMHGGSQAIVAEICTNCTAAAVDLKYRKPALSIDAQFGYHRPIDVGSKIYILTEVEKSSRRFSLLRFSIFDQQLRLTTSGRSTKAFETQKL